MSFFDDIIAPETITSVRDKLIGYAQAAGLVITDWLVGSPGQQIVEAVTETIAHTTATFAKVARGFASLDTSTDPGDVDPYNPGNEALTPEPGLLSEFGANTFGTTRVEASFATGFVTFDNSAGVVPRQFGPDSLVYTWTGGTPPSPPPTYRNAADPTIYTNPDGTVTVAAGATLDIPVQADEAGSASSAPPGVLSLTTNLVGVTGTNAAAIIGRDRESASVYRERCRQAPARTSLGGPADAYRYLARTNLDGTPLLNASDDPVNISRVQVTGSSTTGNVAAYFASPSGAAIAADVTAANTNIEANAFAVPDTITYSGAAASDVPITVQGTAKIKAGPGVVSATVRQAIVDALATAFQDFPVGGFDAAPDGTGGAVYTVDLQAIAAGAFPGLYQVVVTVPAGASTPVDLGEVATYTGVIADWTLTIAP